MMLFELESATAGDGFEITEGTQVVWTETDDWGPVVGIWRDEEGYVLADVALSESAVIKLIEVSDLSVFTDQLEGQ